MFIFFLHICYNVQVAAHNFFFWMLRAVFKIKRKKDSLLDRQSLLYGQFFSEFPAFCNTDANYLLQND